MDKKIMKLRNTEKTWLSGVIAEAVHGGASRRGGAPYALNFYGSGSVIWTVSADQDEIFEMKIGYFAKNGPAGAALVLDGQKEIRQTFQPVKGYASVMVPMREPTMMQSPDDCESVCVVDTFFITKGIHEIRLDIQTAGEFRVYYLEMLPCSAKAEIAAKEAEAFAARPSTAPIAAAGYGLFVHWTSRTKPRYGEMLNYEDAVNAFDTEQFADQVQEMGAKYVIVTTAHLTVDFPAPLKKWEYYHPNTTTKRDLIADLIASLSKRNIAFFMYINMHRMGDGLRGFSGFENGVSGYNFTNIQMQDIEARDELCDVMCKILEEIGERYGKMLKGYWLDGWQSVILKYGTDPSERLYRASKVGNPDRLTSFAFGVRCPTFTPWQDYACGETRVIGALPVDGKYARGQNKGYPYHSILIMDDDWWHDLYDTAIADPQYTADQLVPYLKGCRENGGMVSLNTAVYQNGLVSPKTREVLRQTAALLYGSECGV